MDDEFDDAPTLVTPNACQACGRSTDSVCPGCGEPNTVVVPCDAPTRDTLRTGATCLLSPRQWFFCAAADWFCINPALGVPR